MNKPQLQTTSKNITQQGNNLIKITNQLLQFGENQGFLTYQDINEALPDWVVTSKDIDSVILTLRRADIEIIDESDKEHFRYTPKSESIRKAASIICPDITKELLDYFRRNPQKIKSMPHRKFEELVAAIFENNGFDVELTPQTWDGGFDVLAIRKDSITGNDVHLIECKRYQANRKVDIGIVRALLGVVHSKDATKGHIVTTSFFTQSAKKFGDQHRARLELSNYDCIIDWLSGLPLIGR